MFFNTAKDKYHDKLPWQWKSVWFKNFQSTPSGFPIPGRIQWSKVTVRQGNFAATFKYSNTRKFFAYIKYESCGLNSRKFKEAIEMARTHTAFQPQSIASENQIAISLPRTQVEILVVTQAIQILDNPESPSV